MIRHCFLFALLAATALTAAAGTTEQEFSTAGIQSVRIAIKEGLVQLNGLQQIDTITVATDKRRGDEKCAATINPKVGNTFEVKTDHGLLKGRSCDIDITVTIPANLRVDADIGAGTLVVGGLRGDLNLSTGSGEIRGSVASTNVRTSVGTGKSLLTWQERPTTGAIAADVGTGNATFEFPKETAARVDIKSGLGKVRNQIITNPAASLAISGKVSIGSVDLKYSD